MRIAYFDLIAGASGDMILGALLDAGLSLKDLKKSLDLLGLPDFAINTQRIDQKGFQATKVNIVVEDQVSERHLKDIARILTSSRLPDSTKDQAFSIFKKLAEVEAGIHGLPIDQIHFHELGGVDTIIDVVGTLSGLSLLGIEEVFASPIPLGRGFVKGAHGQIPLPSPATIALLKGVPVVGSPVNAETVTPTAAVLLSSLVKSFGEIPVMTPSSIGYGAGTRQLPIPNLLRIIIGESHRSNEIFAEKLVSLETNIDDMNPEIYDHVMERLFINGALDVFLTPIQMKKNRPGILLQVLTTSENAQKLRNILFEETSTLGVRHQSFWRYALQRDSITVETSIGSVHIKIATLPNGGVKIAPEYEECRVIAKKNQIPIREVYRIIIEQVLKSGHPGLKHQ